MIENIVIATATEMQNNFGRYLAMVQEGNEIIVTKNGKEVGRFIPREKAVSYLTDSLAGILKGDTDLDKEKKDWGKILRKEGKKGKEINSLKNIARTQTETTMERKCEILVAQSLPQKEVAERS